MGPGFSSKVADDDHDMANKAGKRLLKSWQKINLRIKLIILKVAKLHHTRFYNKIYHMSIKNLKKDYCLGVKVIYGKANADICIRFLDQR